MNNKDTFLRIGDKALVKELVKEAKRVKYTVTKNADFSVDVTDPEYDNALVFRATDVGNCWAVTYATAYWGANEASESPATPEGFRDYITARP